MRQLDRAFDVLELLSNEEYRSGETLAAKLGVSRVAIWRQIERLKKIGFWVYGACESGQVKLESVNFNHQVVLVMGAEGRGIKKGIRAHCDHLFSISTQKNFTCLNVSVATALCLHQIHLNQ